MSLSKAPGVPKPSCTEEDVSGAGDNLEIIQKRERLQRLISNPGKFIDNLFDEVTNHGEEIHKDWADRVTKLVHSVFTEAQIADLYKIPALNVMTLKEMRAMNGKIVRFRGMVQEIYDPLLIQSLTSIQNVATGVSREKCLLFTDKLDLDNNQKEIELPGNVGLHEMDLMHFISVPGENKWIMQVDEAYNEQSMINSNNPSMAAGCSTDIPNSAVAPISIEKKKAMFGFPLPNMLDDPTSKAVIGKIYRHSLHDILMNDVLDIYGILMVEQNDQGINANERIDNHEDDNSEASVIRNPPSSLIQRMTVLGYSKQCSFELPRISLTVQQFDQLCKIDDWRQPTRTDLRDLLVDCLAGDTLVAHYVLMNLLSSVNARVGGHPMGSFPVCITGIPLDLARLLNTVIQHITLKSVYLENFLDRIENECYIPWKDYGCDKFMGGILQLSKETHLILEERDISEQQHRNLQNSQKALQNLTALQNLIEWQAVKYDFKYQQMDFLHDIPILILSTSKKSLFTNVIQVPFQAVQSPEFYESRKPHILETLARNNDSKMSLLRDFISHTRKNIDFNISPAMQDIIGNDFSEQHKAGQMDAWGMWGLSSCLTHARYWVNYEGHAELTPDIWTDVLKAEKTRKLRVTSARISQ